MSAIGLRCSWALPRGLSLSRASSARTYPSGATATTNFRFTATCLLPELDELATPQENEKRGEGRDKSMLEIGTWTVTFSSGNKNALSFIFKASGCFNRLKSADPLVALIFKKKLKQISRLSKRQATFYDGEYQQGKDLSSERAIFRVQSRRSNVSHIPRSFFRSKQF